jgi:hypothetical protein
MERSGGSKARRSSQKAGRRTSLMSRRSSQMEKGISELLPAEETRASRTAERRTSRMSRRSSQMERGVSELLQAEETRQKQEEEDRLRQVLKISDLLHKWNGALLKRKYMGFKEWYNYILLDRIIQREKELSIQRQLENFIVYVCQEVRDILESDRCSLWMMDAESGRLWAQQADGVGNAISVSFSGTSFVADCARTREVVHVKDAYLHDHFNRQIDAQTGYRTTSVMCVPLSDATSTHNHGVHGSSHELRGVIQFVNKFAGEYSVEDIACAQEFGNFLVASVFTADKSTDFKILRNEFHKWSTSQRRRFYENRIYFQTVEAFKYDAQILLKCDEIELVLPNHSDHKRSSILLRSPGEGTVIARNKKIAELVNTVLKGGTSVIENDAGVIKELKVGKVLRGTISSVLFVPYTEANLQLGDPYELVAVAVRNDGSEFDSVHKEVLQKLGNQYGKFLNSLSGSMKDSCNRRKKVRLWVTGQFNRLKAAKKESGGTVRRGSTVQHSAPLTMAEGNLGTHLNIFRRSLEKAATTADEMEALEISKNLPDLRKIINTFIRFADGTDKKRRGSMSSHQIITGISEDASAVAITLHAAVFVKERMEKAERMLRGEQRKTSTLQMAVDELVKRPKTHSVRLDTFDLALPLKRRKFLNRVCMKLYQTRLRRFYNVWLIQCDMKYHGEKDRKKKLHKIMKVMLRMARHHLRIALTKMKLYVCHDRRVSSIVTLGTIRKRTMTLRSFFHRLRVTVIANGTLKKILGKMISNCRRGFSASYFQFWRETVRTGKTMSRCLSSMKQRQLRIGFTTLLRRGHTHVNSKKTMRRFALSFFNRYIKQAWNTWEYLVHHDRKEDQWHRVLEHLGKAGLRKTFKAWKVHHNFSRHTASHVATTKARAALNIIRLHAWRQIHRKQRAWILWLEVNRSHSYFERICRKINKLKARGFFNLWKEKINRRQHIEKHIGYAQSIFLSRNMHAWHTRAKDERRLKKLLSFITNTFRERSFFKVMHVWKRLVVNLKRVERFLESKGRSLQRNILLRWSRNAAKSGRERKHLELAVALMKRFRVSLLFKVWQKSFVRRQSAGKVWTKAFRTIRICKQRVAMQIWKAACVYIRVVNRLIQRRKFTLQEKYFDRLVAHLEMKNNHRQIVVRIAQRLIKFQYQAALLLWKQMVRRLKDFEKQFRRSIRRKYVSRVFYSWSSHTHLRLTIRKKFKQALKGNLSMVFERWHDAVHTLVRQRKCAGKIVRAMYKSLMASAVDLWSSHTKHLTKFLRLKEKIYVYWKNRLRLKAISCWADHVYKIKHERKIIQNIIFRMKQRSLSGHFYNWCDHVEYRKAQRKYMSSSFRILRKRFLHLAFQRWNYRLFKIKSMQKVLWFQSTNWVKTNERIAFHFWHLESKRKHLAHNITSRLLHWAKRMYLKVAVQKWQSHIRHLVFEDHRRWTRNTVKKHQNQVVIRSIRHEGKKNVHRCYLMWLKLVNRRTILRKLLKTVAYRKSVRAMNRAFSNWLDCLKIEDRIRQLLTTACTRMCRVSLQIAFRRWRSISWQSYVIEHKQNFEATRREIEKKVMKMPLAWSIMKWQMFAASVSYKELCRAEVRATRTENRQLQSALVDYHRRGLFLLATGKNHSKKALKAPRDAYIIQGKADYQLKYTSGEEMLAATYRGEEVD